MKSYLLALISILTFFTHAAEGAVITVTSFTMMFKTGASTYITINVPCNATVKTGIDGKTGCGGGKYEYAMFVNEPTLPHVDGANTYTKSQVEDFWDWVYTGFTGGGSLDFSENCHGYAFGVGDWPSSQQELIAGGSSVCWVADYSNATIATMNGPAHSIKIEQMDCLSDGGLVIKKTLEKFRESGVYTKTRTCSDGGVTIADGNGPRGGGSFNYYRLP